MENQKKVTKKSKKNSGAAAPLEEGARHSITRATSVPTEEGGARPTTKELGRARGWCWTLYNYESKLAELRQYAQDCKYIVWGFERCPTTQRPHLQGYTYCSNPRSLGEFSTQFNNCKVIKADGSPAHNRAYCLKLPPHEGPPNERYEEYGSIPKQGARTDWTSAVVSLQNGVSVEEVIIRQPHLVPCQRALREFKAALHKPKHREVNVIVVYGSGGSGKTRWAYDNYPTIWTKPPNKSSGSWWNTYDGEKQILLDDYYGGIQYHEFLRVLDRYPYAAPICGGGYVWAQWDTVVITSNVHPRKWYHTQWGWPLRRRLHKIIKATVIDGETNYEEEDYPADEEAWRLQEETARDS